MDYASRQRQLFCTLRNMFMLELLTDVEIVAEALAEKAATKLVIPIGSLLRTQRKHLERLVLSLPAIV